jgi:group I intron endonuclease
MALVYKITNQVNGKVYIGVTTRTLHERWLEHTAPSRRIFPLHKALDKYGKENFTIEEVLASENLDEILAKEIELISFYNSYDKGGYNATFGGEGGNQTPETRAKISASKMGHSVSPELRKKLSDLNNQDWLISTPIGYKITTNLKQFCKDNQLSYKYMLKTNKTKRKFRKGYSCDKITAYAYGGDLLLAGM